MATTFVNNGNKIQIPAPTGGYTVDDVVAFGAVTTGFVGIAQETVLIGVEVAIEIEGVQEVTTDTGTAWVVGDVISFVTATSVFSKAAAATGKHRAGVCVEAKASAAATGKIKLHGS
jgi:predicted RecA/RadA family phage recombinase